jgi:hypothetical protein
MGIDVERRRRAGVSETTADRLDRDSGVQEPSGGEVAKVMQPYGLVDVHPLP